MIKAFFKLIFFLFFLLQNSLSTAANVYLVIGSDTAIWDGMSTGNFNNFYNIDLYVNPQKNAYKIMDPALRARLVDSDGTPLKMTWWMMAGNIFRHATNQNVPIANTMTMYLMQKYHGQNIAANGDELSLHYHTFKWYDFDGDGRFYWNQSKTFMDCFDDFNYTLAQFLLEEQVFPVSFRSGWHYMDNDWQRYLDDYILPYSLHNDYPAKHIDTEEPIDNNYDWSQAPSAFVPYRPSRENYQLPGDGPGWNVRSAHFFKVLKYDLIDTVFAAAQQGQDQVACFWGHLPESNFISNIEKIDSVLHARLSKYPDVKFYYCTAVEAMQRWRQSQDFQQPEIEFTEEIVGDEVYFKIRSHEKIFQKSPFVAVKDVYEDYQRLECEPIGINTWRTMSPVKREMLAKAGVAVCDTFGNQTLRYIQYLADDVFIDNLDENFSMVTGSWQPYADGAPWGTDALICPLNANDSVSAAWQHTFEQQAYYNLFVQIPAVENKAGNFSYVIYLNDQIQDTISFQFLKSNEWQFLKTLFAQAGDRLTVELQVSGAGQEGKLAVADVLKISAMVRDRDLRLSMERLDFGEISWGDTAQIDLELTNIGREILTVTAFKSQSERILVEASMPLTINPMSELTIPIKFFSEQKGDFSDTLTIESNDPKKPRIQLPVLAKIENYFEIIDNEDTDQYQEFGEWFYSVAHGYGGSSRYAWLNRTPAAYARFFTTLKKNGVYELFEIVPKTENASNHALYEIRIDNAPVDSVYLDQNEGSGNWKSITTLSLPKEVPVEVRVIDSGKSTQGAVLRADAVKFLLIREVTDIADETDEQIPETYRLSQNFPNPFNASTTIRFNLPQRERVQLNVYNLLGKHIKTLLDGEAPAGVHRIIWDGRNESGQTVSSGIYYYSLRTPNFTQMKKMILLK
ncbi:golvesin C-terminal-like domain-containing protein [Calditrichota bacterium GD2]